jgi:hypothetical protein
LNTTRLPTVVIVITLLPITLAAQGPATTFDALRATLQPNDRVRVTHADGHRSRGRVQRITDTDVTVRPTSGFRGRRSGADLTYSEGDVLEIKRTDSLGRGFAIGMTTGLGLGSVGCFRGNQTDCALSLIFAAPPLMLIGMGVGALIDRSINETIFRGSQAKPVVSLVPHVGRRATGVSLALTF